MDEFGVLNARVTDLSPIMSSFLAKSGIRYHVHPECIFIQNGQEMCMVCVDCLRFVQEESTIGAIDPALPDAEVELAKIDASRQKSREKSFTIAAGCDYGVLSRIVEMTRPSILERALLCPHRAYYLTVKVKNPSGLPGSKSLQGDIICFTQDGPAEALKLLGTIGDTVRARVAWVRGGGNFRVVTVDDQGSMENWLHDNAVLLARPHVLFNELRIRAKMDEATGNENGHPAPQDTTFQEDFVLPLDGLAHEIFQQDSD